MAPGNGKIEPDSRKELRLFPVYYGLMVMVVCLVGVNVYYIHELNTTRQQVQTMCEILSGAENLYRNGDDANSGKKHEMHGADSVRVGGRYNGDTSRLQNRKDRMTKRRPSVWMNIQSNLVEANHIPENGDNYRAGNNHNEVRSRRDIRPPSRRKPKKPASKKSAKPKKKKEKKQKVKKEKKCTAKCQRVKKMVQGVNKKVIRIQSKVGTIEKDVASLKNTKQEPKPVQLPLIELSPHFDVEPATQNGSLYTSCGTLYFGRIVPPQDRSYCFWRPRDELDASYFDYNRSNGQVIVLKSGTYLLNAQVLFHDTAPRTAFNVRVNNNQRALCLSSSGFPAGANKSVVTPYHHSAYHMCSAVSALRLAAGDTVDLHPVYPEQAILTQPESTHWQLVRLGH